MFDLWCKRGVGNGPNGDMIVMCFSDDIMLGSSSEQTIRERLQANLGEVEAELRPLNLSICLSYPAQAS